MYREIGKAKTAAKTMTFDHDRLKKIVLETIREASLAVGSTLGPNGKLALLERQEQLEPFTTKDGITVFNSIAYSDPTKQAILEAARSSSSKTNVEAGDGTTTATILAEALIRLGFEYVEKNPRISFQKIMRELETTYRDIIQPFIKAYAIKINEQNSEDLLKKVALIATNNDEEMAQAVINAFELVGHNGNITIDEVSGSSGFQIEKIEGLPIARGFEDSCGRFLEEFINDRSNYRTTLEKPRFILYNGKINDVSILVPALTRIAHATGLMGEELQDGKKSSPNVIVIAHHFSEGALAFMAQNFKNAETLNILPLRTPMNQQTNSPFHFLHDVSAFTGAKVFDPMTNPVEAAQVEDFGLDTMRVFEYYRYRSLILGEPNEPVLIMRAEELEQQAKHAESQIDGEIIRERMALLTGGVARVKVLGSSEAELKEKKHRVEDAVMAIKGALREGVLPGCGKTLLTLSYGIANNPNLSDAVKQIMAKAFGEPFERIFTNGKVHKEEIQSIYKELMSEDKDLFYTYDAFNQKFGNAIEMGVIDSASAVLMAIKNSLAVAKMLMGLSGIIVFKRDFELDVGEAKEYSAERAAIQEALKEQEKEKWEVPI